MIEDKILASAHKWLWNNHPETRYLCWHIANERNTSSIQGAILRAKGVLRGAPDYVVNWNGIAYYFEFKSDKGKQTPNQIKVMEKLVNHDFKYFIINEVETFKKIIDKIIC